MARRKTLPQVSPKVANELKPLVTAIKEIIETGEGVRGDPLDRKITLRDLVDSGIVKIKGGLSPNNPGSLEPSPPPPNLSVPPAPTGFNAIGGFDGRIDLTWDIPGSLYSNHAYTNIYRAEEDNFANAILVGREAGAFYTDVVRDDVVPTPYYYWISFTSTSDIEGPLNATAGTMAQALDIDYIVGLLDGKISESELANELLTPIQSIPSIQNTLDDYGIRIPSLETTVGNHAVQIPSMQDLLDDYGPRIDAAEGTIVSHENDITSLQASVVSAELDIVANADAFTSLDTRVTVNETEIATQAGQITSLQSSLNDLTIPAFDATNAYSIGELFRYDNVVYEVIATQSQPNATPPNATYYVPQPDYETIADTVSANSAAVSALDTRVTAAEGTITAQGTDITLLQSDLSTAEGNITANANATSSLDTRVTTAEGNITSLSGDITTLQNGLSTTNGNVTTNANAINSLQTEVSNIDGVVTSQSTDITQLQNDLNAAELDVTANAGAITSLTTRVDTAEGEISSQSTQLTNLNNSLTTAEGDITANSQALTLLDNRVTSAEGTILANSADITQLQADVQALDVDGNAQALQDLDVRVTANEQDITAVASDVTTLTASVGDNTSALQTKAEVSAVQNLEDDITVLSAQYTIKLDVNGRVAGIGLANVNGASEFIVASDAVYFIDPGQSIAPFDPNANYSSMAAVRDTQLVFGYAEVEGFKRFVINVPAYIPEGYIESGMVGAISFGKITTDTGVPVTTVSGKLKADYIDVDNLAVASAATFYGDAQSGNYAAGSAGWRIQQSGTVEFYNGTFRGRIEAETGYFSSAIQIGGTGYNLGSVVGLANEKTTVIYRSAYGEIDILPTNGYANPPYGWLTSPRTDIDAPVYESVGTSNANGYWTWRPPRLVSDSWKKPGYTLIDGNKIFTGDAYVDTLQIKGEAVTIPAGARRQQPLAIGSSFTTVASFNFNNNTDDAIGGILTGFVRVTSAFGQATITVEARAVVNGTPVEIMQSPDIAPISAYVSLPKGVFSVAIQARQINGSSMSVVGSIAVIGAKR